MSRRKSNSRLTANFYDWAMIALKFVLGVFVGVHLYALALKVMPVPGTVLMVQRSFEGEKLRRQMVSIEDISPHLVRAVIAAEDARFCEHNGVDVDAIKKAIDEYNKGKSLRGASTITQQTAKNVFLWNGGGMARKGAEAWFATFIDGMWGKRRVMEAYLNVAEWGDGIFGAEAAAQARFGKSAAELTEREAALLAAVLPSPNKWRLDPPGPYVTKRAGTLQARMRVVQSEGLVNCVLGDDPAPRTVTPKPSPSPAPGEVRPETPAARPVLPDLPPAPDEGPEAVPQDVIESAPAPDAELEAEPQDEFDAFLESAQDVFDDAGSGDDAPETEEAQEPEPDEETGEGPVDLRPRPLDP
ncbi:MAG: monofunctional biosynthetic peptidoglycan transglycosylase [Hyphomonas sp.]|uniref:monofunctional biosynthetic peptidoglycan transglycosylase n=1 Tax=Hyphomonas sp. TaxID=87 RepID=UPI003529B105